MTHRAVTPTTLTRPALAVRLPYPVSANHLYRIVGGRLVMTAEGHDYKRTTGWLTKEAMQQPGAWPIAPPFDVTLCLYVPDARRRDVGNVEKAAIDGMFAVLGEDDSLITSLHIHKAIDRSNPRLDVVIRCAEGE